MILLAGQLGIIGWTNWVRYSVDKLKKDGSFDVNQISNTSLSLGPIVADGGLFSVNITLPTGWYRINVQQNTGLFGNTTTTKSVKVGVGEVIFFAGQSNAQGVNGVRSPGFGKNPGDSDYSPEYDCVSAVNNFADCYCKNAFTFPKFSQLIRGAFDTDRQIAPNGSADVWYYEALGKKIVDKEPGKVIPVVFFNNGQGGTTVENWKLSAGNSIGSTLNPAGYFNCSFSGEEPAGQPYKGLKTSLNYYGGMLGARGVVWHQGETDALPNIITDVHGGAANTRSFYNTALSQVIAKTRQDFNGGLGWAISRVSRIKRGSDTYIEPNVRDGQTDAKSGNSNTQWGAYFSDDITDRIDGTHFNTEGLKKMAEMYSSTVNYTENNNGGNILGLTQVTPVLSPKITPIFTNNRTTVTLGVSGSYSDKYCWVKNEAKMDQCSYTTSTITLPNLDNSPTERWRCYVTNSLGTTTISQEAVTPLSRIRALPTLTNIPRLPAPGPIININSIGIDWKLENAPSWASLNVSSGTDGNTQVDVTVTENTASSTRSGTIQLKSADGTLIENIPISQQGTGGGGTACQCGFTLITVNQDAGLYTGSYTFNSCSASTHKWKLLDGATEIANSGTTAYNVSSSTVSFNLPTSVNTGNYQFRVDADNCVGTGTQSFSYTKPGGTTTTTDRTEGGTASDDGASNPGSEGEANAFDNQSSTKWLVFSPTGNIAYDFANEDAYIINSYTVTSANDASDRDPKNWNLQGSNDGTNWTMVNSQNNQSFGSRFEVKTYPVSNTTAYKQYRLNVTANNGSSLLQIAEIQLFGPAGTGGGGDTDRTESGTSSDDGANNPAPEGEEKAFDNTTSTKWLIFSSIGNIAYDFFNQDAYAINKYTIGSANDAPDRDPKNWNLQGSNNGSSWITVDSRSNETFGSRFETRAFTFSNSTAYKQYRLNVTANNGSGLLQIGEIQMFGPSGIPSGRISNVEEESDFISIFPNPTNGKIKVGFTLQKDENVWFNLYDTQGKNLQLNDFEGKKGRNEVEFDLQNYPSGAYFIDLQYNQKREVRKVMKVN
jgi:hypothetical protein